MKKVFVPIYYTSACSMKYQLKNFVHILRNIACNDLTCIGLKFYCNPRPFTSFLLNVTCQGFAFRFFTL